MAQEMTRDALVRCLEQVRKAAEADNPDSVPPPSFIMDMTDRELCEWDVKLYELAIEAMDQRALRTELFGSVWTWSHLALAFDHFIDLAIAFNRKDRF
jgi:hypothetical protein